MYGHSTDEIVGLVDRVVKKEGHGENVETAKPTPRILVDMLQAGCDSNREGSVY